MPCTERTLKVQRVHIGTTHFVNAVVERRELAKVAVLRLCGPASTELPPFVDFPAQLLQVLNRRSGVYHIIPMLMICRSICHFGNRNGVMDSALDCCTIHGALTGFESLIIILSPKKCLADPGYIIDT